MSYSHPPSDFKSEHFSLKLSAHLDCSTVQAKIANCRTQPKPKKVWTVEPSIRLPTFVGSEVEGILLHALEGSSLYRRSWHLALLSRHHRHQSANLLSQHLIHVVYELLSQRLKLLKVMHL